MCTCMCMVEVMYTCVSVHMCCAVYAHVHASYQCHIISHMYVEWCSQHIMLGAEIMFEFSLCRTVCVCACDVIYIG